MQENLVEALRRIAWSLENSQEDSTILLNAAREIEYLQNRIARLEGLA